MNVLVIDGQGGKMGRLIIEGMRSRGADCHITAIGTNSIATATMLKAGANQGATGENPVLVCVRQAHIIIGPVGIAIADSLLGEVTPAMARAVGQCAAKKLLLPVNRCNNIIVGIRELPMGELVNLAVEEAMGLIAPPPLAQS